MLKLIILYLSCILFYIGAANACTTAIVSGKHTADGRPLLFKHRDTGFSQNKLMYFSDGAYDYIGTVNSSDSLGDEVWAGINSAGFAIMNSEAYNLNVGDTTQLRDQEGVLMKKALQTCATLVDFEQFLENYVLPRGVRANFGVIDAQGGAAYYETGNFTWEKYDANDPAQAPFGYLIRTNFAFGGVPDKGYGYIRYQNAENLLYQAAAENNLSHRFIIKNISRCLSHSLTGADLHKTTPPNGFVSLEDYIPRYSSASTTVVQGIKAGEDPKHTTMWTILGWQLTTVAIPVWINHNKNLPRITTANENGIAQLCDIGLKLKQRCYPVQRGSGKKYLYLPALLNEEQSGILQKILPLEDQIITKGEDLILKLRSGRSGNTEIKKFYGWLDEYIPEYYDTNFSF